ncbi:late competence protein ComER [Bacillus marinisedimentorum]|uniref:late competence protein ComER n=1 Tax=Bacillus marinisedimentorum TaxID=1821260 RepID=UPI0008729FFD|nr:late competence protein ComER [Bacillus marinisedimentorum]
MKIGIIGTGNMGSILAEAMIESQAIPPSHITVTNRTLSKARSLQRSFPDIKVAANAQETALNCDFVFICVKPKDIFPLLQQIKPALSRDSCLVSITSPVSIEQLESAVPTQVARVIPSITNRALSGVSLVTFGHEMRESRKQELWKMLEQFSLPVVIQEDVTRAASDIVSCGPAFISYLLQRFIDAGVKETKITREQATTLMEQMMIGFGKLMEKEIFTLETLQEKVCVKGGVTGEGIEVLKEEVGPVFEHLFQRTHAKYERDKEETKSQFGIY